MLSPPVMSDSLCLCGLQPTRLLCPWDSPGKNSGVGCHALLQGIFLTHGSNLHLLCLLHWQAGSLLLALSGKPAKSHSLVEYALGSQFGTWLQDSLTAYLFEAQLFSPSLNPDSQSDLQHRPRGWSGLLGAWCHCQKCLLSIQ